MAEENTGKFLSVRVTGREQVILDEMVRRDFCENTSQAVRAALREFARNHEIEIPEAIPA